MGPPDRDARDEAWFSTLYTTFYPHIHRYGVRRLPHADAASELATVSDPNHWFRGRISLVLDPDAGEVLAFERVGPVGDTPDYDGLAEYRLFLGATGADEIGRLPR